MWGEKLSGGVLRVLTPVGPRYVKLSSKERLYLLWMFRHIQSRPEPVLSQRQQKLIDRLCADAKFTCKPDGRTLKELPVIGTVERRVAGLHPELRAASEGPLKS